MATNCSAAPAIPVCGSSKFASPLPRSCRISRSSRTGSRSDRWQEIGGVRTFPCSRATLYSKSPPYSMIPRVISSVPPVNSESGIASPRRIRSIRSKSVEVKTPRFWQFSR